jgi:hypothetical protein
MKKATAVLQRLPPVAHSRLNEAVRTAPDLA